MMSVTKFSNTGWRERGDGSGDMPRINPFFYIPPKYAFILVSFTLGELGDGLNIFQGIYLVGLGWNEGSVGTALSLMGMTALLVQTWVGDLVDTSSVDRRMFLAVAGIVTALSASVIMGVHEGNNDHTMVYASKIVEGVASSFIAPCMAALTLASFGPDEFDTVMASNILWGHFGSLAAAVLTGYLAYALFPHVKYCFLVIGGSAVIAASLVQFLPEGDPLMGRGFHCCCTRVPVDEEDDLDTIKAPPEEKFTNKFPPPVVNHSDTERSTDSPMPEASSYWEIFTDKKTFILCWTGFFFHFANTNVLLVLGELMSEESGREKLTRLTILLIAVAIVLERVIMALTTWIGDKMTMCGCGRKPLLIAGLISLPIRCALLILWRHSGNEWLLSTQILDGVGAGLFDLIVPYLVADITFGSGRFNLVMGLTAAFFGLGMTLSNFLGQHVVEHFGHVASLVGSIFLSIIAIILFWLFMPETLGQRGKTRGEIEAMGTATDADVKIYQIM